MDICLKNRRKESLGESEIPKRQLSFRLLKACCLDGLIYFGVGCMVFTSCGVKSLFFGWHRSTAAS